MLFREVLSWKAEGNFVTQDPSSPSLTLTRANAMEHGLAPIGATFIKACADGNRRENKCWKCIFSFQPCMTKTEKSGIVLRNCATISKREEMCEEEDEDGATLCYCLTGMEYEPWPTACTDILIPKIFFTTCMYSYIHFKLGNGLEAFG